MALKELENFRKKYPQYGDMNDRELALKLAKKYPDAYGYLAKKVAGKKKAWTISTPEELVKSGFSPISAGLIATGQQLSSPLWKYGNILLGGLPNKALQAMGYEAPEAKIRIATPFGEKDITPITDTVAGVGGFIRGVPMKIGGRIASKIPGGRTLLSGAGLGVLKGATQLGLAAGLTTPLEESFQNWKARAMRATGAGAFGAITGGISGIASHFSKLLSEPVQLKTAEQVRSGFRGLKDRLTNWFGKKIIQYQKAHPTKRIDLTKQMKTFEEGLEDKAKFRTLLRVSPRLRKAKLKVAAGQDLTLKETQDLINQLKNTILENQLAGFKVRPSVGEVRNFINSLQKQKHLTFPQMKYTDKVYGEMETYSKSVEEYMKYGKTAKGLKTMFSNPEQTKALRTILPKEVFQQAQQLVKAQKMSKQAVRVIDYLIRYGILYKVAQNLLKNVHIGGGYEIERGE